MTMHQEGFVLSPEESKLLWDIMIRAEGSRIVLPPGSYRDDLVKLLKMIEDRTGLQHAQLT